MSLSDEDMLHYYRSMTSSLVQSKLTGTPIEEIDPNCSPVETLLMDTDAHNSVNYPQYKPAIDLLKIHFQEKFQGKTAQKKKKKKANKKKKTRRRR